MKITPTIENTKTESPKIDSAGVDTGAKMLVGLIGLRYRLRLSRPSLATFCWLGALIAELPPNKEICPAFFQCDATKSPGRLSMSGAAVILFACGLLCGLAGCAGGVRYPRYYVLDVPQPPAPKDTSKPILGSAAAK